MRSYSLPSIINWLKIARLQRKINFHGILHSPSSHFNWRKYFNGKFINFYFFFCSVTEWVSVVHSFRSIEFNQLKNLVEKSAIFNSISNWTIFLFFRIGWLELLNEWCDDSHHSKIDCIYVLTGRPHSSKLKLIIFDSALHLWHWLLVWYLLYVMRSGFTHTTTYHFAKEHHVASLSWREIKYKTCERWFIPFSSDFEMGEENRFSTTSSLQCTILP